jgi:hypothetical protein
MGRSEDANTRWQVQARAAREALAQWRQQHPTATFTEIEAAVDQQLDALRAALIADLARASRAADLAAKQAGAPPRCPSCGERLASQGQHRRHVLVQGGQTVDLHRDYAVCPACGRGLLPPG